MPRAEDDPTTGRSVTLSLAASLDVLAFLHWSSSHRVIAMTGLVLFTSPSTKQRDRGALYEDEAG